MTVLLVEVNGVNIACRVKGEGPPLVLIMGYRLNSTAWPLAFIDQLAQRFTVITMDNRGTGLSDKPLDGYAIANMARDVRGVLDHLDIEQVDMLALRPPRSAAWLTIDTRCLHRDDHPAVPRAVVVAAMLRITRGLLLTVQ